MEVMNKNPGRCCLVLLFGWLAAGTVVAASAAGPTTRVTVDTGKLQGQIDGDVTSFKGIPFALPPVGALR